MQRVQRVMELKTIMAGGQDVTNQMSEQRETRAMKLFEAAGLPTE